MWAWVVGAGLVVAWTVLGYLFDTSPHLGWLPKWSLAAAVLAPAAWILIYTVQGISGPGKWWESDLGTNMVWLETAAILTNGLVAWAVFFHGGILNAPGLAWAYVGGLLAGALIITWRSIIWVRAYRHEPPMLARVKELTEEVADLRRQLAGRG